MDLSTTSLPVNIIAGIGAQNSSNDSSCVPESNNLVFVFIPPFILLISVLGILLNVIVLMVFCLHKKSCTSAEIYLSSLSAADLVLVSFLPFWASNISSRFRWTFGRALCKIFTMSIMMNSYCSIYVLVLASLDCYLALVYPVIYERIRRPIFAKLGCVIAWILGFLLRLPSLIYRELTLPINNVTRCFANYPNNTLKLTSELLISVFGFIIPIFIISFCTFKIITFLQRGLTERKNPEQKETTLVLTVLLVFLICWVPYYLIELPYTLRETKVLSGCNTRKILISYKQIFTFLSFFNSILNPVLYITLGKNFQIRVKELFSWRRTLTFNDPSTTTHLSTRVHSEDEAQSSMLH